MQCVVFSPQKNSLTVDIIDLDIEYNVKFFMFMFKLELILYSHFSPILYSHFSPKATKCSDPSDGNRKP